MKLFITALISIALFFIALELNGTNSNLEDLIRIGRVIASFQSVDLTGKYCNKTGSTANLATGQFSCK